jgi:hypothetical protein
MYWVGNFNLTDCPFKMAANVWGFVQWPIRDPGSRAAKSRSWVKYRFLDQISSRPCQPDMSLGFILSLRLHSDGHCTKPNVSGLLLSRICYLTQLSIINLNSMSILLLESYCHSSLPNISL